MSHFLYIWGQPGSGKSTLVRALTAGSLALPSRSAGVDYLDYGNGVLELGKDREDYRGTDALGMSVITKAIPFVASEAESDFLAEGDRLAVSAFFSTVKETHVLELVYLNTPDEIAAQRRAARGSNQNESWVRGRMTKARNLANEWDPIILDGDLPVSVLVQDLREQSYVAARFTP